jgi:hypothetical protein
MLTPTGVFNFALERVPSTKPEPLEPVKVVTSPTAATANKLGKECGEESSARMLRKAFKGIHCLVLSCLLLLLLSSNGQCSVASVVEKDEILKGQKLKSPNLQDLLENLVALRQKKLFVISAVRSRRRISSLHSSAESQ